MTVDETAVNNRLLGLSTCPLRRHADPSRQGDLHAAWTFEWPKTGTAGQSSFDGVIDGGWASYQDSIGEFDAAALADGHLQIATTTTQLSPSVIGFPPEPAESQDLEHRCLSSETTMSGATAPGRCDAVMSRRVSARVEWNAGCRGCELCPDE